MRISRNILLAFATACVLVGAMLLSISQVSGTTFSLGTNARAAQFDPGECDITISPGSGTSLNSLIAGAANGSTICLRAGVYQEQMIVRPTKSNLIITGYPGERPIIDGNKRLPGTEFDNLVQIAGTNITFQNFEVRHSTGRGISVIQPADTVIVRDVDVHDNWQSGILLKGKTNNETNVTYVRNVTIEDSRVYNNVRKAKHSPVVYLASRTGSGPTDWEFNPDLDWDSPVWEGENSDIPEVSMDGISLVLDGSGSPTRVYISTGSTNTSYIHPSFSADGQEIAYAAQDILYHTPQTNKWTLFFDGTVLGLPTSSNIDAFWVDSQPVAEGCAECYPILMSFGDTVTLPGLGSVGSGDIVQFTPTQPGRQTEGTFSMYRSASQLVLGDANIDVIDLAPPPAGQTERQLVISTADGFSLSGGGTAQGQDLIAYDEATGTWSLYFDHSALAFHPLPEGLTAAWIDNNGNVYISGDPAGGSALVFIEAKDSIARRNEVYENYGEGIVAGRLTDHATFEDNISWDNLHANLYLNATTYPVADSNLIYCTDNREFWRKTDTRFYRAGPGLVIRDEKFANTNAPISVGQVVINNIVVGCGRNFYVSSQLDNGGLHDAVIANNVFFEAQGGAGSGSVNVRFEKISFTNSRFSNNILYQTATNSDILRVAGGTDLTPFTVTNNLYYPAAPGSAWFPSEPGRVVGNPLLVNPSINTPPDPDWYMLQTGSPAIDAAIALPEVTADFFNNARTGTPDIGAHEFGGGGGTSPASLTVVKQVSGRAPAADWQFTSSFAGNFTLPASGGQQLFENLGAGGYTVSETAVNGYVASVSCTDGTAGSDSVTVNLDDGDDVVCTFTNTASPGVITINKTVVGSTPGSDWVFSGGLGDFTLPAAGGGQTFNDVPAGVMTVTETAVSGWTAAVSCDNGASGTNSVDIDLLPGASVTCTFTNTAQPQTGAVTIVKQVVGQAPVNPWAFSGSLGDFTLPASGGSQTFNNVPAGSIMVTETAVSGYTAAVSCDNGASGSDSVNFNLASGGSVTCTFTNTAQPQPGSITVVKQVVGSPPVAPWAFSGTLGNFTLPTSGGSQTFNDRAAGSYTITESVVAGYSAAVSCNNGASGGGSVTFSLDAGQSVTCTFVNTQSSSSAVTFRPTADAYVDSTAVKKNYGTVKTLKVRNAAQDQIAYLKFNATGLTGSIQSATLRLYVTNPGPDGGNVYSVVNDWTERGIKWNNRPVLGGSVLDSAGAAVQGQWVELDVTAAITGNGTFSFGVWNNATDAVIYSSREAVLVNRPQLVIVTN